MNRRCRLLFPATLLVVFTSHAALPSLIALAAQVTRGNAEEAASATNRLIADLDSEQYAVRKKATRGLIAAGAKVVPPLAAAASKGTLEVQTRVIRILQEMYTESDNAETVDAAELAIESLAESSIRSLAARASRVLEAHGELREQRALAAIERLGGIIKYGSPFFIPANPKPKNKPIGYILLGDKWKGGDDGLKFIKRVTGLPALILSGTAELSPISKEAQKDLQATLPNLSIQIRGRAYLGIGGGRQHPRGFQIGDVVPDRAAAKAGLKRSDVITVFGGKKIPDFDTLVALLKTYKPGDKVKVELLRGTQTLTVEVVMGEWAK